MNAFGSTHRRRDCLEPSQLRTHTDWPRQWLYAVAHGQDTEASGLKGGALEIADLRGQKSHAKAREMKSLCGEAMRGMVRSSGQTLVCSWPP